MILDVVRAVPRGRVASYGDVAAIVTDLGGRAGPRSVARCLARHGGQPGVPWWRVVRADGGLAAQVSERAQVLLTGDGLESLRPRDVQARRWRPTAREVARLRGG